MAATEQAKLDLQKAARDHLWMHFTRMGGYGESEVPIIVRGDGCYLEDSNGKRYLDALAGLFSVNIGYGYGEEIGQAALEQMRELPFYTNWSYAHPRAIELAARGRLARARRPEPRLLRLGRLGGGRVGLEARAPVLRRPRREAAARRASSEPEVHHDAIVAAASPRPHRTKAIARHLAYHGTTMGALSLNGIPAIRAPFEPLVPEVRHVRNTNRYHRPAEETEAEFTAVPARRPRAGDPRDGPRDRVPRAHGAGAERRRLRSRRRRATGAACARSATATTSCSRADEVITGFGRLGYWFGSERYDIRPDIITCAKGLSSSYAAIGAVIATDRVMEPFLDSTSMYSHGITFGGHPVMCAIALKNIEIMKREGIVERVREHEAALPRHARAAARPADRRRPARGRLPLRDRARQGQGDARDVLRRGVRDAAARLPLAADVRAGADLPRRRPGRPGDPDLAAARRGAGGVRRDRGNPR